VSFAVPKSVSLTCPSAEMRTFSGFRSRCAIPRLWMYLGETTGVREKGRKGEKGRKIRRIRRGKESRKKING
jgi:hypothetical protein